MSEERDVAHEAMLAVTAGLAVQANKLTAAAQSLATSTEEASKSYRFSRRLKAILLLGAVCMGLLVSIAWQNLQNGSAIRSCTTPTGICYERSQRTTNEAVATIVARIDAHTDIVFIATIECSRRHHLTDRAFEGCLRSKGVR